MNRFVQILKNPSVGWTVFGSAIGLWMGSFLERDMFCRRLYQAEALVATHPDKTQTNWQIACKYRAALGIGLPEQLD